MKNKKFPFLYEENYKTSLKVIYANQEELLAHEKKLNYIKKSNGNCLWISKKKN